MIKGVRCFHGCPIIRLTCGKGWFLRIAIVYFNDNLEYFYTFPISILKEAFQEAFHVLIVT